MVTNTKRLNLLFIIMADTTKGMDVVVFFVSHERIQNKRQNDSNGDKS
jgi:hypothetical protein